MTTQSTTGDGTKASRGAVVSVPEWCIYRVPDHLRAVGSNASRVPTLREEAQVTAYMPQPPGKGVLVHRAKAARRHASHRLKLPRCKVKGHMPWRLRLVAAAVACDLTKEQCLREM